jgi:hypothetical protein
MVCIGAAIRRAPSGESDSCAGTALAVGGVQGCCFLSVSPADSQARVVVESVAMATVRSFFRAHLEGDLPGAFSGFLSEFLAQGPHEFHDQGFGAHAEGCTHLPMIALAEGEDLPVTDGMAVAQRPACGPCQRLQSAAPGEFRGPRLAGFAVDQDESVRLVFPPGIIAQEEIFQPYRLVKAGCMQTAQVSAQGVEEISADGRGTKGVEIGHFLSPDLLHQEKTAQGPAEEAPFSKSHGAHGGETGFIETIQHVQFPNRSGGGPAAEEEHLDQLGERFPAQTFEEETLHFALVFRLQEAKLAAAFFAIK